MLVKFCFGYYVVWEDKVVCLGEYCGESWDEVVIVFVEIKGFVYFKIKK